MEHFDVLHDHLIVKILAYVAKHSMRDLLRAKISCKTFYKLAEEDYIYCHLPIDNILWRYPQKADTILQRCIKCDNMEALYWQGLHYTLTHANMEVGIELLQRATQLGHLGASYVVGILFIGEGGMLLKKGVELLRQVYASKQVVECRKRYLNIARWHNATILRKEPARYDCVMQNDHCKRSPWVRDIDHYDETECEQCICRAETQIIYKDSPSLW